MDELLTRKEAAAMLRTSLATLARWAYEGKGPRYIVTEGNGKCLYRRSDIEAWLRSREKAGTAA